MEQPQRRGQTWLRRIFVLGPILVVCAIGPWLIPWGTITGQASDEPSTVLPQPASGGEPSSEGDRLPDEQAVSDLADKVDAQAQAGYDLPVSPDEVAAAVQTKPGAYAKVGRLQIPELDLDVAIGEGVYGKPLDKGPGHWPGTPMPGTAGNAVISGHRNTHTQPFKYINELQPGDKIIARQSGSSPVAYRVQKTTIVPEEKYKTFVLRQPSDDQQRQITLFACHPEGNPTYRIVVEATAR